MSAWKLLLVGLAVAMILEGLPYFISPSTARRTLAQILALRDGTLRTAGLVLMLAGLLLAWWVLR